MDRFLKGLRRRGSDEETIERFTNDRLGGGTTDGAAVVPDGYEIIEFGQPDGTVVAVRRKLTTWELAHRDSLMSSRPSSSTPSYKTVTSRTSDGKLARVQRPDRGLPPPPPATSSRLSQRWSAGNRASIGSSLPNAQLERDTMRSTMTIVEDALAEQLSIEPKRHSLRDTMGSGTAISGTSGDIHIGHMEDVEEYDNESDYASSDYEEADDSRSEQWHFGDGTAKNGYRKSYGSCALFENANFTQQDLAGVDAKVLPSPPSAYISPRDTISWGYAARTRAREHYALQKLPSLNSRSGVWARRLGKGSSYLMAALSIILPAAFLALGVLVILKNGQTMPDGRSTISSVVKVAAAVWPVVFAAVVAQGFKTWFLVKAGRWNSTSGQAAKSGKFPQRLQVVCLLVFLVWCLSPLGSQALLRACGYVTQTQQTSTSTDVWYVDRTGYNAMWSVNSTLAMSAADRSELVQIVSEKYISSLVPSLVVSNDTSRTPARSLQTLKVSYADESLFSPHADSVSSSSLFSLGDATTTTRTDSPVESSAGTMTFSMVTSRFEFTCDKWHLMQRRPGNTTSSTNMSYSSSQTLGMSMLSDDNSTRSMNTIKFASLNKISAANGTRLARRYINSTSLRNETWEYSSIQCGFQQNFYKTPIQCERDQGNGTRACVQSGQEALILSSPGLSDTELGDFAQDFVSANLPSAQREATATETYIQNGGSVEPVVLRAKRANYLLLNLSATVTPDEFAQRFGRLFNTWVSFGYCPQCTSDMLAGNNTAIPAPLQPFYRQVSAETTGVGEQQIFTINVAWLAVFFAFAATLLMVAIASVAVEVIVTVKSASTKANRGDKLEGEVEPNDGHRSQSFDRQLPKTVSSVNSYQFSPEWAKGVMHDMETAAEHSRHIRK